MKVVTYWQKPPLPHCLQFFVAALQFFVSSLDFLGYGFELFIRSFLLLNHRVQVNEGRKGTVRIRASFKQNRSCAVLCDQFLGQGQDRVAPLQEALDLVRTEILSKMIFEHGLV